MLPRKITAKSLCMGIFMLFLLFGFTHVGDLYAAQVGGQPAPGNPGGQPAPGNVGGESSYSIKNPLKVKSITGFLVAIVEVILVFATPIIVLYIMYAGFLFVTANGEPEQIKKARNALLFAVIGGVIVLGAFLILEIVQGTVKSIITG